MGYNCTKKRIKNLSESEKNATAIKKNTIIINIIIRKQKIKLIILVFR